MLTLVRAKKVYDDNRGLASLVLNLDTRTG